MGVQCNTILKFSYNSSNAHHYGGSSLLLAPGCYTDDLVLDIRQKRKLFRNTFLHQIIINNFDLFSDVENAMTRTSVLHLIIVAVLRRGHPWLAWTYNQNRSSRPCTLSTVQMLVTHLMDSGPNICSWNFQRHRYEIRMAFQFPPYYRYLRIGEGWRWSSASSWYRGKRPTQLDEWKQCRFNYMHFLSS